MSTHDFQIVYTHACSQSRRAQPNFVAFRRKDPTKWGYIWVRGAVWTKFFKENAALSPYHQGIRCYPLISNLERQKLLSVELVAP